MLIPSASRLCRRRLKIAGLIALSVLALYLVGPTVMCFVGDAIGPPFRYVFDDRSFDRAKWLEPFSGTDCARGPMADDLIQNHLRKGQTQSDVTALLGKPDRVEPGTRWGHDPSLKQAHVVWDYHLGNWSVFRMDEDFLSIAFDRSGRVIMSWHWQS